MFTIYLFVIFVLCEQIIIGYFVNLLYQIFLKGDKVTTWKKFWNPCFFQPQNITRKYYSEQRREFIYIFIFNSNHCSCLLYYSSMYSKWLILFLLFSSLTMSTLFVPFQSYRIGMPMPFLNLIVNKGDYLNMVVTVSGAKEYKHIVYLQQTYPLRVDKDDKAYHRSNNYSLMPAYATTAIQLVYIVNSENLAKVQMSIFSNGLRVAQNYALASQYDKGLHYVQINTNKACKIKVATPISGVLNDSFSLFISKNDALKQNLERFLFNSQIQLPSPGIYYIRVNTNISLFGSTVVVEVATLSDNPCQNLCIENSEILSLFPTTSNVCQCRVENLIYDQSLRKCSVCLVNATSRQQCTGMRQFCGNKIRTKVEECDNGNQEGCINCKVGSDYTCKQNGTYFSTCQKKGYPVSTAVCGNGIREQAQGCDNGNRPGCTNCFVREGFSCTQDKDSRSVCSEHSQKIIIGFFVGIASAIVICLMILIIMYLLKRRERNQIEQREKEVAKYGADTQVKIYTDQ